MKTLLNIPVPYHSPLRKPDYRHIIAFIAEENRFVFSDEIINDLVTKTGKERGSLRLYLLTTLKRMNERGQIILAKSQTSSQVYWGLPGWLDREGRPLHSHRPREGFSDNSIGPFGIK